MGTFQGIRKNVSYTRTAAYHQEGNAYVVTLWTADTDRFAVAARFPFSGPSYQTSGKVALAKARARVASLVS